MVEHLIENQGVAGSIPAVGTNKKNKMTIKFSLKELVGNGRTVHFIHYRQNELWYATDNGFEFPVPIADTGDGVFLNQDKAILFMRYIRKHLANIEEGRTQT